MRRQLEFRRTRKLERSASRTSLSSLDIVSGTAWSNGPLGSSWRYRERGGALCLHGAPGGSALPGREAGPLGAQPPHRTPPRAPALLCALRPRLHRPKGGSVHRPRARLGARVSKRARPACATILPPGEDSLLLFSGPRTPQALRRNVSTPAMGSFYPDDHVPMALSNSSDRLQTLAHRAAASSSSDRLQTLVESLAPRERSRSHCR